MDEKEVVPPSVISTTDDIKKERIRQTVKTDRLMQVWTVCVLVVMTCVVWIYLANPSLREFERKFTWSFQFALRDKLNRSPEPDPRLRILMFDDSTVQQFKRSQINLREWAALLSFIDRQRPSHIYIDKIFSLLDDEPSQINDSLKTMSVLRTPVSIGAFTSVREIPGREKLLMQSSHFRARNYLPDEKTDLADAEVSKLIKESGLKDRSKAFVYGPIPQLQEIFLQGHIDYPFPNQVFPLYDLGNNQVLPSLGLSGQKNLRIEKGGLTAGGKRIPTTSQGSVLVNWLSPAKVYAKAESFASAFAAMRKGTLWDKIPEGSHVLIMPLVFTGNVDFKDSPYGSLPAGLTVAAMINSGLTKQWLSEFEHTSQALFALVLLAGFLKFLKGSAGWTVLPVGMLSIVAAGLYQFVYKSVDLPWMAGSLFFGFSGVTVLAFRSIWDSKRDKLLTQIEEDYERLEKEEKRLQKEMKDAARVASALMPENVPQWPGFEITGFHRSMSEASGDWYFFERSQSGRFAHFVLFDISGHGVQAALVVSGCKTILSMVRMSDPVVFENQDFLLFYAERVNKILYAHGRGGHTATMLGMTYDFETEKLYYLNCGHPFPIIHSMRGDKIEPLIVMPSDPVGFNETLAVTLKVRPLKVGESLIAHSDGVPLTRSKPILRKYFKECEHSNLISARRLQEAIVKHCKKEKVEVPEDDVSLVVMRRTA